MVKYTREELNRTSIHELRVILRQTFNGTPGGRSKGGIIEKILEIQEMPSIPERTNRGRKTLDKKHFNQYSPAFVTLESNLTQNDGSKLSLDNPTAHEFIVEHNSDTNFYLRPFGNSTTADLKISQNTAIKYDLMQGDVVKIVVLDTIDSSIGTDARILSINGKKVSNKPRNLLYNTDPCMFNQVFRTTGKITNRNDELFAEIDKNAPIIVGGRTGIMCSDKDDATAIAVDLANRLAQSTLLPTVVLSTTDEMPESVAYIREKLNERIFLKYTTYGCPIKEQIVSTKLASDHAKRKFEESCNAVLILNNFDQIVSIAEKMGIVNMDNEPFCEVSDMVKSIIASSLVLNDFGSVTVIATFSDNNFEYLSKYSYRGLFTTYLDLTSEKQYGELKFNAEQSYSKGVMLK